MEGKWIKKPTGDTTIIWVHGILSNGESCWKYKEKNTSTYWPDLLSKNPSLSSLGNFVFTYQTNVFSGTYSIFDIIQSLRELMKIHHVLDSKNLVFICHSMGGIIVRKYLCQRQSELIADNKSIGLILIASPSLGSNYASWIKPIASFMGHQQAKTLTFINKNEWLRELDNDFRNLKESNRLKIVGRELTEDKFILLKGVLKKQVVEPFSGECYFSNSIKIPNTDHFSIAKPKNEKSFQHKILIHTLLEWENEFKKKK